MLLYAFAEHAASLICHYAYADTPFDDFRYAISDAFATPADYAAIYADAFFSYAASLRHAMLRR